MKKSEHTPLEYAAVGNGAHQTTQLSPRARPRVKSPRALELERECPHEPAVDREEASEEEAGACWEPALRGFRVV